MKVVNLTPHPLDFVVDGGKTITIAPSGQVARVDVSRVQVGTINIDGINIPVNKIVFGDIVNLPDPQPNTVFIVSAIVANAVRRYDVLVVDDLVRDDQGRVIGARAIAHVLSNNPGKYEKEE